jgi:hypothetical protein
MSTNWTDRLTVRARNCICLNIMGGAPGLENLDEVEVAKAVARLTESELLRMPNLGRVTVEGIQSWLANLGLNLADTAAKSEAEMIADELAAVMKTTARQNGRTYEQELKWERERGQEERAELLAELADAHADIAAAHARIAKAFTRWVRKTGPAAG